MRFHWFAQVEGTRLPADYRDHVRSAWVTPDASMMDPLQIGRDYHMYLRLMQQADELGWDGLLVNEHHQTSHAMSPSPNLLAAILAATTKNAAINLCGNSLALYNPPIRVAEEMAMLDCLSEGRLIAGMVFGTPMDTAFSYGIPPVELRERYHEARELILRAWAAAEPFAFNGKYTQLRYVNPWPRPVQEQIPIWVPGTGSVETWEAVTEADYCYGYLSFMGSMSAQPIVDGFWAYCDAHGGSQSPHRMAFTQIICCADSDREAERDYADAVRYFFRNNVIAPEFASPPGYLTTASLRAGLNRQRLIPADVRARAQTGELDFWEYDELGFIIAGTPERVEQKVRKLTTDLRVGQLITCMHVGDLSEEVTVKNNHLFATQVMPRLRDLWADDEDRWTPRVSQQRVAALSPDPLAA